MSLNSASQTFTVSTDARPYNVREEFQLGRMPEVRVSTENCSLEGSKAAFLKAMEEFTNSPHFEWLVYQLDNEFDIKVKHSVTLSI